MSGLDDSVFEWQQPEGLKVGDLVKIGYDPETDKPIEAEVVKINGDGSAELEY